MTRGRRAIATLLTINALLIGGLLWMQIAGAPPDFARAAYAQQPNAGLQREQMIRLLNRMARTQEQTHELLSKGYVRVVPIEPPEPEKP